MTFRGNCLSALCVLWFGLPAIAQVTAPRSQRIGVVVHGGTSYLGIGVMAVDSEIAKSLGLKEERGVEITDVVEDGPAFHAGLKEHDVILDYGGQRVEGTAQFVQMVAETPINRVVRLGVVRNGNLRTVSVQVGQHGPETFSMEVPFMPMPPMPPAMPPSVSPPTPPAMTMPDIPVTVLSWQNSTLGFMSEPVEGQLAEFFGVKEGVLIRSVAKQSPAERAGLKAGDVIVKVDSTRVRSPREVTALAHRRRDKKSLSLTIVRSHKELTLELIATKRAIPALAFGQCELS